MGNTLPRTNFSLLPADTDAVVAEQKMLFIGQKLSTGTATAGTLIKDIQNDNSWDVLFGKKSMLASMIRQARAMTAIGQYMVQIDAIALEDAESAVASSATVTFTGTATEANSFTFVVGSEFNHKYKIDISKDATATTIATALKDAINADLKAPFSATSSSGEVTITFANKGTVGNGTTLYFTGSCAGVTVALVAFASGATDPVVTSLTSLILNARYQAIVQPVEYGLDTFKTLLDGRFNTNNKVMDGVLFASKTDTLANLKTFGASLNSPNINIQADKKVTADSYKGSSIPEFDFIKSVYNATIRALRNSKGAQLSQIVIGQYMTDLMGGVHLNTLPFFNSSTPLLNPIMPEYHWSSSADNNEVAELNEAGLSVWDNNSADTALIMGEQLTTYKTDRAGNEDITWKFLNYRDTGSAIREYRFVNFKKDFAQHRLEGEDAEQQIRNAFLKYFKATSSEDMRLTRSGKTALKYYNANLKIAVDFATGTVTVVCKDPYVTQLRQIDGFFKATFDITT